MNIVETILDGSARHGRRPAIIRNGHILEYENLRRKVCDAAEALRRESAGPARVGMPLANTVDDIVLALALMLNGHTLIALPPNAMDHEKTAHLQCCMAESSRESTMRFMFSELIVTRSTTISACATGSSSIRIVLSSLTAPS